MTAGGSHGVGAGSPGGNWAFLVLEQRPTGRNRSRILGFPGLLYILKKGNAQGRRSSGAAEVSPHKRR